MFNLAHNIEEKERTKDILLDEDANFNSLLLRQETLAGLQNSGFVKPSPIQLKAIPLGKCGLDLIVKSKSGTGKTAVFVIITLEVIDLNKDYLQAVVLAPTREIAVQIEHAFKVIGAEYKDLKVANFIGGLPVADDKLKLLHCQVAVGAPGRMKHLIDMKLMDISAARLLILDEADKLVDESFQGHINYIYHMMPARKQMLAVSATYPDELDTFLARYMYTPTHVVPATDCPMLLGIQQCISIVKCNVNVIHQLNMKTEEIIRLLSKISYKQCIIFTNHQTRAATVSHMLNRQGLKSLYLSANQVQKDRLAVLKSLHEFTCQILVTTDLTARGIDAANVDLVINFDLPFDACTYFHRMGRSGRYGTKGICINLAAKGRDVTVMQEIIGTIGGHVSIAILPADNENFPENLWDTPFSEFEQLPGIVSESSEKQKETLLELQKYIYKYKSTFNKSNKNHSKRNKKANKASKRNDTYDISDQSQFENDSHETETNVEQNILNRENCEKDCTNSDESLENEDDTTINKLTIRDLLQNYADGKNMTRQDIPEESITITDKLRNIAKDGTILSGESYTIDSECIESVEKYLDNVKQYFDQPNVNCIVKSTEINDSMENFESVNDSTLSEEFENIFIHAYDYAINTIKHFKKPEWLKTVDANFDNVQNSSCIEDNNLLYIETGLDMSDYDVTSKKRNRRSEKRQKLCKKQKRVSELATNLHEVAPAQKLPETDLDTMYAQNETYQSYFQHYSDLLVNEATTFENVEEFESWFKTWNQQVQCVRDYVQQNIYLQEMNNYQYYYGNM